MKLTTDDLIERLGAGALERFASKVIVIPSGCFVWTGHVGKNGYGQFSVARNRSALAHRVSFWLRHGRLVPSGLQIDHLCRNRACVNPQGTHLGHVLSALWFFGLPSRAGTHFDDRFIKMRGGLDEGRVGNYQRQVKYKLQAAMELGILEDDRSAPSDGAFIPGLTPVGHQLLDALKPYLQTQDLKFPVGDDGVPSTQMSGSETEYNDILKQAAQGSSVAREVIRRVFLGMPAVGQMLAYLYHVARTPSVEKSQVYREFFEVPLVKQYCDREGIDEATEEASKRRCPFLLNVLEALDVVRLDRSDVIVRKLLLIPSLVKPHEREDETLTTKRLGALAGAWKTNAEKLSDEDLSILRELFGPKFMTDAYMLDDLEIWRAN